jgi:hypothetical protein
VAEAAAVAVVDLLVVVADLMATVAYQATVAEAMAHHHSCRAEEDTVVDIVVADVATTHIEPADFAMVDQSALIYLLETHVAILQQPDSDSY